MKRLLITMMAAMVALFVASPAMAQATRTWVSGVGDDANPCSRTAPCKTFAGAISKTATGGEIDCLDPGGFGTLTITKSITIDCTGTFGSTLASGTNGFLINDAGSGTPGTAKVVLRGLSINGAGTTLGNYGVRMTSGRELLISNVIISNFAVAGVSLNSATFARVTIANSTITNATVGVQLIATGGINSNAKIVDTTFALNSTSGISVDGTGGQATINRVSIFSSPKSLDITNGGVVFSYGNNALNGATTDAPTPVALQ